MNAPAIPLGLYVHIPWCVRKCPYCDFNSHARDGAVDENGYVQALLDDLATETAGAGARTVRSVFIGGGTPSLLSAGAIERLLEGIASRIPLAPDAEITLEANPGAAEASRFAAYRRAGVNRLSIGVQSLNDEQLYALGRIHSAAEAMQAFAMARASGFDNINLDLMYGLPGQTPAMAIDDLDQAMALGPAHLSWYQLTLEPNTAFHHRPPQGLPDDDGVAAMEDEGRARLARGGFARYEISAYAADGHQCRHNINYWTFGDYIGIGAGAHGKLTLADGRVERRRKARHPAAYMRGALQGNALSTATLLQEEDLVLEFMMNALRLEAGVPAASFCERTGLSYAAIESGLARAGSMGLIETTGERICATDRGRRFLNDLLLIFSPRVS